MDKKQIKETQKLKNEIKKYQKDIKNLKSKLESRKKVIVFKVSLKEEKKLYEGAVKNKLSLSEYIRQKLKL